MVPVLSDSVCQIDLRNSGLIVYNPGWVCYATRFRDSYSHV